MDNSFLVKLETTVLGCTRIRMCIFLNFIISYEGEWKNNNREGYGKLKYHKDGERYQKYLHNYYRYEGYFVDGKFSGKGSYYHKNDLKEVGEYKNGKSFGEHKVYDKNDQLIK